MSEDYCSICQHPISEATTCNHPNCEYKMQEINKKLSELEDVTYTQPELDEALRKQKELEAEIQALKLEYEPEALTEGDFIEYEAHQVNVSLCSKEELKQAKLDALDELKEILPYDLSGPEAYQLINELKKQIEDE